MYKKQTHRVRNTVLFVLLVILLVGLGYILSKEWAKRFGPGAQASSEPPASMAESSAPPASSEPVSSEPEAPRVSGKGVALSAADAAKTGDELAGLLAGYREQGYAFVLLELKAEDGKVLFDSQNEMARSYGAVSAGAAALDSLTRAVREAGLAPVGRISALKDPLAAHVRNGNSYAYNGDPAINWMDNRADLGGKPWLNPYMENARSYISGLCGEAAERGVEAILLTNVNFPTTPYQSNMGLLNETTIRENILLQLMAECRSAAGDVPVYNSYDAAWAGASPDNLTPDVGKAARLDSQPLLAPELDLDAIAANKEAICRQYAIVDQNGYDPNLPLADVVEGMLHEGPAKDAGELLPVVRAQDVDSLLPVFEKLEITSYVVE